jgi:hypothetical protein
VTTPQPLQDKTTQETANLFERQLPRGAWASLALNSRGGLFLLAIAEAFRDARNRALDWVGEMLPGSRRYRVKSGTTWTFPVQTIAAWESECGLDGTGLSISQRRTQLIGHLTATGGNSEAYFIGIIMAGWGVDVGIDTYTPWTCADPPCRPLYGLSAHWHWTVVGDAAVPAATRAAIEAIVRKYCPAHTVVSFAWTA